MQKLLVFVFLSASFIYSQGWQSVVNLPITGLTEKLDIYSNSAGNHLIVTNYSSDFLKYFLLKTNGDTVKSRLIDSYGNYPVICGDNNSLFICYVKDDSIKVKKSTNNGDSWLPIPSLPIGDNDCSGMDALYNNSRGLLITWSTLEGRDYETYYQRLNLAGSWIDFKEVTDYGEEVGGRSSIALSSNKVHISYNTLNIEYGAGNIIGEVSTRDYNFNTNSWEDPLLAYAPQLGIQNMKNFLQQTHNCICSFMTWKVIMMKNMIYTVPVGIIKHVI